MSELFGSKIRVIRLKNNKTLISVAREIGVSTQYLVDIENSNRLPFPRDSDKINKLFKSLNIVDKEIISDLLESIRIERSYIYKPIHREKLREEIKSESFK